MPISYQQAIAQYAQVQGNILKGHGRDNAAFLFVNLGADTVGAKRWIADLLTGSNGQPLLTSTSKQLTDTLRHKVNKSFDGGLFASLLLSAAGYRLLGEQLPQEVADQAPFAIRDEAFSEGMRTTQTQDLLQDPAFDTWDEGWFSADGQPTKIHALLLLADDNPQQLAATVAAVKKGLQSFGARLQAQEQGKALFETRGKGANQTTVGIEHFGYADGISQPIYLSQDANPAFDSPLDVQLSAEELVLVPEPTGSFGSFFVFRKLAQDVPGFNKAEDDLDKELTRQAQAQGIVYANDGGAELVGRTEAGTPVTLHNPTIRPEPPITNNFDYNHDASGQRCPFHAHIRKMNPRSETGEAQELRHRLTRRGIPYGEKGAAEVGLLFMCYQRNIAQQFEFLQTRWANNPDFVQGNTGLDSIIGQGRPRPDIFTPFVWDKVTGGQASFAEFVTLKGGEYFYAPSLLALQALTTAA